MKATNPERLFKIHKPLMPQEKNIRKTGLSQTPKAKESLNLGSKPKEMPRSPVSRQTKPPFR
jgi:hypothetical protein